MCSSCFEEQYGKILLQSKEVEYHCGHKDHSLGGILSKHSQPGKMYLTEIAAPLNSVILNRDIEQQQRQKFV